MERNSGVGNARPQVILSFPLFPHARIWGDKNADAKCMFQWIKTKRSGRKTETMNNFSCQTDLIPNSGIVERNAYSATMMSIVLPDDTLTTEFP